MFSVLIKSKFRVFSLGLLFLMLATSAVLIFARWKSSASTSSNPATTQERVSDSQLEAELVTATPAGFEPSEITRPQGRFLLAVDNRSGLDQLDLYLERESGTRLNTAVGRRGKLKWREILDLPAGHYVLRATNDRSWRCGLNLTTR